MCFVVDEAPSDTDLLNTKGTERQVDKEAGRRETTITTQNDVEDECNREDCM